MKPALVHIDDVGLTLSGRLVFEHVSFDIHADDIILIIGPNGAGKTMLLKTLLGFIAPTSGSISVLGNEVPDLSRSPLRLGYVPQRLPFDRDFPLTVEELLSHTINFAKTSHTVDDLLESVGAASTAEKSIGMLSGGQWQRVLLARALANDPTLLILDEPTSGVDASGEVSMFDLVHNLHHSKNVAVIMISHDLALAARISSHVICLNQRMVCSAPPRSALTDSNLKALYGMNLDFTHEQHTRHD